MHACHVSNFMWVYTYVFLPDAVALPGGHFGVFGGPVLVYDLVCLGAESSLLDCSHSTSIDGDRDYRDPGVFCPLRECTQSALCHITV